MKKISAHRRYLGSLDNEPYLQARPDGRHTASSKPWLAQL